MGFVKFLEEVGGQEDEEIREITENVQVSTLGNWIDGDILYQYGGARGRVGLRWKMMGLVWVLRLSLKCSKWVIQIEMLCR